MDASDFFAYPSGAPPPPAASAGFLEDADEREWDTLLSYMQTQLMDAGETVFDEGQVDRALYLLTAGRLELSAASGARIVLEAPAPVNEIAFLDDGRCPATGRALSEIELLRLSFDAFESLALREPVLARRLLLDLGRILARALRSAPG